MASRLRCGSKRQIEWWSAPNAAVQVLDLVRAKVSDSAPKAGESGTLNVG
ncbi:hypothetical protein [Candidatus Neomicrothrix sp.]|nr:hypothetical protein [Candidatus Microthrix sp.]